MPILNDDRVADEMHNLSGEKAIKQAFRAAISRVASDKEYEAMWIEPYRWQFKDGKGRLSLMAEYRKAYGTTVATRRNAQIEEFPWGEQEIFDKIDEKRAHYADKFTALARQIMAKHRDNQKGRQEPPHRFDHTQRLCCTSAC